MNLSRFPQACVFAALVSMCVACTPRHAAQSATSAPPVSVATTSTILASLVSAVGGDAVDVRSIVPAGASVESYEPTPSDVAMLGDAKILVENGAGLEIWLAHLLDTARNGNLHTVVASDGLPLSGKNPHLWMDPENARAYVRKIAAALIAVDPARAPLYRANAARFDTRLIALERRVAADIETIPAKRRNMVVYHDAWEYYDARFGLRTIGVIEEAPGREPSAAALSRLIDVARDAGISVVFSEPEESARLAAAVSSSLPHGRVVPLNVDSLDPSIGIVDYPSLIWSDTRSIVESLK